MSPRLPRAVMIEFPTGTVTFLLTDVEGSTELWEQEPHAMGVALARHDALVAAAVSGHGGVLVKSRGEGDSCFAVFGRARDAVAAALELQRALRSEGHGVMEYGSDGVVGTSGSQHSTTPSLHHSAPLRVR